MYHWFTYLAASFMAGFSLAVAYKSMTQIFKNSSKN